MGDEESTVSGCLLEFGGEEDTLGVDWSACLVLGCDSKANCKS